MFPFDDVIMHKQTYREAVWRIDGQPDRKTDNVEPIYTPSQQLCMLYGNINLYPNIHLKDYLLKMAHHAVIVDA